MNQKPNFSFEELVVNDKFREWVLSDKTSHHDYWQAWLLEHPEQESLLKEATAFVQQWEMPKKALPKMVVTTEWHKLQEQLHQPKTVKIKRLQWIRYAAAAVLIGVIGFSGLWYWNSVLKWQTYTTNYAEIQNITLPDGSDIVLNANSTLKFVKNWETAEKREVWLEGEGYFSVAKKEKQQFVVHANDLDVEVLGTEFDVISRKNKTRVVLTEGKIKVNFKAERTVKEANQDSKKETIVLEPNEILESEPKKYVKKTVETEVYESWKDDKLAFNNTPITELVRILEDNYGMDVVLWDDFDANNSDNNITGTIPVSLISKGAIFAKTLEEILEVKLIRLEGNKIKLEKLK